MTGGVSSRREVLSTPQHLRWSLSFCLKKRKQTKMHKKRNMHDFPIYHCLTSFEHVCKDLRGRMGKEESGGGGRLVVVCLGLWNYGSGGLGQTARLKGELYIFYSSSVWWKWGVVCPSALPMIPPSHYHPTSPQHTHPNLPWTPLLSLVAVSSWFHSLFTLILWTIAVWDFSREQFRPQKKEKKYT